MYSEYPKRVGYYKGVTKMIRLFDTHKIREVHELDGMWDFTAAGSDKNYTMPVPGCWEQHPDFLSYRGSGIYTKKVYIKRSGNIRLEFKGVSHTCLLYTSPSPRDA